MEWRCKVLFIFRLQLGSLEELMVEVAVMALDNAAAHRLVGKSLEETARSWGAEATSCVDRL